MGRFRRRASDVRASKPMKFSSSIPHSFDGKSDLRTGDFGGWNTRQDLSSNGLTECLCNIFHLLLAEAWVNRQREYLPRSLLSLGKPAPPRQIGFSIER